MRVSAAFALALLLSVGSAASAQERPQERPQALNRLVACRSISATAERLACYDREVAAVDAAERARDLVVVDRQQVRRTRRSLFGLALPNLGIFGDDNDDDSEEEQASVLESTIRTVRQDADGKWTFTLEDGARWTQVDTRDLQRDPRPGNRVRIRRAGLGSYLANIDGQLAIRVRRIG